MKRKFVQIAVLCLSAILLMAAGGGQRASASAPETSERIIRVGLHHDGPYGTGTMEGLNFQNGVGSGFRFGYYDSANRFVAMGSTAQKDISVVKAQNVYYGSYNNYISYHSALTSSAVAVGVYHLQLPGSYDSFEEAQAAASQYPGGFPAYIEGTYYARVGCYTTSSAAKAAQAELGAESTLSWTSKYAVNVVVTGTNTILFQYDDNGGGTGLGIEPIAADGEKGATWGKGYLYNGGFRFERIDGGNLTVVNIVGLEDYVKGVVPYEMSDSWPIEALKAGAVAARSYALSLGTKHNGSHFDICDNTHCQVYYGRGRAGDNSDGAVDQTAGQMAIYNGKIAQTAYYSSNGGASESSSTVWGGNQANYPYLVGKVDPYEASAGVKNDYSKTVSSATLVAGLKKLGYNDVGSSIVSVAIVSLTDSGNPKQVTFTDNNGKQFTVNTRYVKSMLGLQSYRYGLETGAQKPSGPGVSVNGSAPVDSAGLYAIDGEGNVVPVGGDACVITDSGVTQLEQGSGGTGSGGTGSGGLGALGSTTGNNGMFTFVGKGWGHNVGLSQWGAYAMAKQGYTYLDILQFYYTGITVGYM